MNSREAFEAVYLSGMKGHARRNEHGDYVVPSINDAWAGWQAATAHARDVAVRVCEEAAQEPRNLRLNHSEAISDCADAIKEALK